MQYGKQCLGFKLCSMVKHSPNGKGMIYGSNGKGIMAPIEYTPLVYSPNGKGMVLSRILFRSGHGKRYKKYITKNTVSIKISFMH